MTYFLGLLTRCKDETFIEEFCEYYLNQGVDEIHIIDDDSSDKSIYKNLNSEKIKIYFEQNIIKRKLAQEIYSKISKRFTWMIYVDVDEFITTRKNINNTIADELKTVFKRANCIKIPWVFMACDFNKQCNSILKDLTYRMNHDLKHPNNSSQKFRCRYDSIEVKCIFKTSMYKEITDHHPIGTCHKVVNSIDLKTSKLNAFYNNLREHDIANSYLICYHYRITSLENCITKVNNSIWYQKISLDSYISSNYPEVEDETMKNKALKLEIKN